MQASYFSDYLVSDTLKLILSKLELKNQRHARLVCKQWFDIINLSEFRIGALLRDELPSVVSVLGRYNKPISVRFKTLDQFKVDDVQILAQLTNLRALTVTLKETENNPTKGLIDHAFLSALTNLQSLTTEIINTSVFTIAKSLTKLCCNLYLKGEKKITDPVARLLELEILGINYITIPIDKFPNLTRITCDTFNGSIQMTGLSAITVSSTESVDGYSVNTLTELIMSSNLHSKAEQELPRLTRLTRLKHLHINRITPKGYFFSHFPDLEYCCVRVAPKNSAIVWQDLARLSHLKELTVDLKEHFPEFEQISALTTLRSLNVYHERGNQMLDIAVFSSLVNLTQFIFRGTTYGRPFNFKNIPSLTALQYLCLYGLQDDVNLQPLANLTYLSMFMQPDFTNNEKLCLTNLTNLVQLQIKLPSVDSIMRDFVENFDMLTRVTSLTMNGIVSNDDWSRITKLTNLRAYCDGGYIKDQDVNKDRFTDLTALKHLTLLMCNGVVGSYVEHLTALTTLQEVHLRKLMNDAERDKMHKIDAWLPLGMNRETRVSINVRIYLSMKRSIEEVSEEDLTKESNKKLRLWSPVDFLVSDTLKLILSKLDLKNQRHARLVCKQWFDIINLSEFNIGALYHNELPSVVSVLSRYNKPISVSFKNLDQVEIYDVSLLTQLTNLTNLSTNIDQRRDEFLTKLTDLQSLKTHTISTDIFGSLYKLTKLSCNELETGEFDGPFTQLEDLEIIDEDFSGCINDFPNLKRLSVDTITEDVLMLTRLELLHLSSTLCSEGYPITLTELNIHELLVNKQKFYDVLTNLTNLKSLHLDSDFPVKHVISKFPLLEHLDVGLIDDNEEDFLIWKQLDQLTHLKFLEASFVRFPKEQCITPLTRLLTLMISPTQDIDLDVSVFSSLVNLTALSISNDSLEDPTNIYGYTALTSLTALQRLYVDYSVKESFMNNMTDLTTLRVSLDDDFKTTEKHCFTKLTNLQELDIVRPQYVQLHSVIDGFGYLPLLTRLSLLDSTVSDEDWNSITKLTNLVKYYERQFIGHNKDRFADLTAMQHLTFLCFGKVPKSTNCDHLTNLTRIQELSAGLTFYEAKKKLLEIGDLLPLCKKPLDLFSDFY